MERMLESCLPHSKLIPGEKWREFMDEFVDEYLKRTPTDAAGGHPFIWQGDYLVVAMKKQKMGIKALDTKSSK